MSRDPSKSIAITITEPKDWAAGVPAVVSAYKNVSAKVGPIKGSKLLSQMNQFQGFDCPGCAWPDPLARRATFEFCENGAKAVADEATLKRIGAKFFAKYSVQDLLKKSDRWLNDQGRITEPMLLPEGGTHYQPISWEHALELIANQLNSLPSPDQAAFYTSGRTSNEAAFLYQLFVRKFGTNNLPDCSNMCHESSGVGLTETIGIGKGTVTLEDLENAQAIFVFGQNPGSNHPRMLTSLQKAKRNGAKIVAINPLDEAGLQRFKNPQEVEGVVGNGTALRDLHLPIKINGDVAFLKGLCRLIIEREELWGNILDHDFIEQFCHGYQAFKEDIVNTSWTEITSISGLSREQITLATDIACESKRTICCWAMGMTQHKNAVANIQLMTNFLMLQGNLGKTGAGVCPVRGHSNVQGDRTMGIWEKPSTDLLNSIEREFKFVPPQHHGVDAVDCAHAMLDGRVKVMFALGGNYYKAMPDHDKTSQGLNNCLLTVQVSTKLNRSHLYTGKTAIILPALGRTEIDEQISGVQTVTVENSMGVIQTSHGKIPPASKFLKSEVTIVAELADKTLGSSSIKWLSYKGDYSLIRDHIGNVIPGFEDFNKKLNAHGEFVLPNPVRDHKQFKTETNKANFIVNDIDVVEVGQARLLLMTIRSHDQFNTTVYTDNDRYRGIKGNRRVIFISQQDATELKLLADDWVDIHSHWQGLDDRVSKDYQVVIYPIPKGCAAAYYPETNNLIPISSVALKSNTPAYKSVVISLHKKNKNELPSG
jgi:molybdopterin-dependent oxidoreductase alpha subunit